MAPTQERHLTTVMAMPGAEVIHIPRRGGAQTREIMAVMEAVVMDLLQGRRIHFSPSLAVSTACRMKVQLGCSGGCSQVYKLLTLTWELLRLSQDGTSLPTQLPFLPMTGYPNISRKSKHRRRHVTTNLPNP